MRTVVVTYLTPYKYPALIAFGPTYKNLTDERLIRKAKGWCKSNIIKLYEAGEVRITFYADIMDITTAVNIPL